MELKFIEKEITYTGKELSPHWIYKNFHIQGSSLVAFIGPCDVSLSHMLDLEDVIQNKPIYSQSMLHFIIEHFGMPLQEAVSRQRLFICLLKDIINHRTGQYTVTRNGDDLYVEDGKLSVSIASVSYTSALIHCGLNITSQGTPVKTAGLSSELAIHDIKILAKEAMFAYTLEDHEISHATWKVKGVSS